MCCFSSEPVEEDPYKMYQGRQWETSMMDSCTTNTKGWCLACFCPPCMSYTNREKALQYDMTRYKCCQGYICGGCAQSIPCQESNPNFCLCMEVVCCASCAISATRIFVQVERQIQTDPCDNRIIRFNNCMQLLSCFCHILAAFHGAFRNLAQLIDLIADIVYCITQACMQAQVHHELTLHPSPSHYGAGQGAPIDKPPQYQTF